MTVDDFIKKLDILETYMQEEYVNEVLLPATMTMAAEISTRIKDTGVLSNGKSMTYSTKPMLIGKSSFIRQSMWDAMYNKDKSARESEKNVKGTDKKARGQKNRLKWVTVIRNGVHHLVVFDGGYKRLREIQGRQGKFKDYFYRGEMWAGYGIKSYTSTQVTIGGMNKKSQEIINGNSWRDKTEIIAPNKKEIEQLNLVIKEQIIKKINDILNS